MIWNCPEGHSAPESRICPWCEIERLRVGHERYETVRRMNVPQFKEAVECCLRTGKPFDELIDDLRPFLRPT